MRYSGCGSWAHPTGKDREIRLTYTEIRQSDVIGCEIRALMELGGHALERPEILPCLTPITMAGVFEHLPAEPKRLTEQDGTRLCSAVRSESIKP
jgi:hypothetical protein